jgi:hypothetical protein
MVFLGEWCDELKRTPFKQKRTAESIDLSLTKAATQHNTNPTDRQLYRPTQPGLPFNSNNVLEPIEN